MPGVFDLIDGNVTVQKIREVRLEDLLGREPVEADLAGMSAYIAGRVILVTGGGSIGSELCRQIADFKPRQLLILDNCENNAYDVEMELSQRSGVPPLVTLVKDIRDQNAVNEVFRTYRPEVVFMRQRTSMCRSWRLTRKRR